MGFASAFASGLIKGFHQNILNEQKHEPKMKKNWIAIDNF